MSKPTSPDYRTLCAELLNGLDELVSPRYPFPGYTQCAMDRARAALLSQPEPEEAKSNESAVAKAALPAFTDEEIDELWDEEEVRHFARAFILFIQAKLTK